MRFTRYIIFAAALLLVFCQMTADVYGQLGISYQLKKPKEFDNRTLRSEKSDKGKFGFPKRFIQNTITHYNYVYNANNKLNEVLGKAKLAFKDDYSQLLPFYNYSLDVTAVDTVQLDSISYKSQTGLALHDLRNDWADNLYLMWGITYYLKKDFDSAYMMFQFINYAFAKKEKDGYYLNIGSKQDGNNAFSISSKENNSLPNKVFSTPPSRNEAFIWQIRNFLAQDLYTEAASLIIILKNDALFPSRLKNDLEEVQAYWFYKQKMWDSSAAHLVNALSNATNKQEQARWEYLLAQLYEMSGQYKQAENYYSKAIGHTTDPILDIYARLYMIRVNKDGDENYAERNVAMLLKMAKRDKYQDYRDIIYYMAAQMELERKNTDKALTLLEKSTKYSSNDPALRNKTFLQLAELSFAKRLYRQAYNFYDSLKMDDPALKDPEAILSRKAILGEIATSIEIIERQDSLQKIANMPEEERKDFVRKIVRQLRSEQGYKDDGTSLTSFNSQDPPPLFNTNASKGEWYFYNKANRQRGAAEFKAKWGNRVNQDNWRRSAAVSNLIRNTATNDPILNFKSNQRTDEPTEITFEGLYDKLPLTPEQLQQSNDSIQQAMFNLGIAYIQKLEDCPIGTETLEQVRQRFPAHPKMDEVLFNLYYCYNKNGETAKAEAIKKLMNEKYSSSNFNTIITTGKNPASATNVEATKMYEGIYDLFIEGKFEEAIAQKKIADSLYSNNFWTPQLLYIEAVYYIRQRQDSAAKTALNNIINQFPQTPLAAKATTMRDVLARRSQIEQELTNLVVNRPAPDTTRKAPVYYTNTNQPAIPKDTTGTKPVVQQPPIAINNRNIIDTTAKKPSSPVVPGQTNFSSSPAAPHYVVIVLNKVDPVFVNEAKNAFAGYNRDTYYNKQMNAELVDVDPDNRLLLISPFKDAQEAIAYVDRTRPVTASQIVPWLKGGKYFYSIITQENLEVLKNSKDLDKYKQFLDKNFPGKF